jgi:hypothetical protein
MDGRFADAAIANASDTRNATSSLRARNPPTTATRPITIAVVRATRTSSRGSASPPRMMPA